MSYTKDDVKEAWQAYLDDKCLCVLKNGKWEKKLLKAGQTRGRIDGTRAEVRDIKSMMGFPQYLEKHYK